jgi:ketosteroid isomerase-like protein
MLCVMDELSERIAAEIGVLEANQAFYRAFRAGDVAAMSEVWAQRAPTACIHPGLPPLVGRSAILGSWRQILGPAADWEMSCRRARVHMLGQTAFVTCLEANGDDPAHLVATNVFVLEDGHWRMTHHHAGPLSEPVPSSLSNVN